MAVIWLIERFARSLLILMTVLLFTILHLPAEARPDKGIKAGVNLSSMAGDVGIGAESSPRMGTLFGGFLTYHVNDNLAIQPELLVSMKGIRREVAVPAFGGRVDFTETAKLTYLEIPILLKFPVPTRKAIWPSVFVGPAVGFGLMGKNEGSYTVTGTTVIESSSFKGDLGNLRKLDFSLVIGGELGFMVGSQRFTLDIRYVSGLYGALGETDQLNSLPPEEIPLYDLRKDKALDIRNEVFSISIGLLLGRQ
ncbi:MAG: PorT family protein [FCB group bacterium]|nr:PorT family protein [FCB group bacterium]